MRTLAAYIAHTDGMEIEFLAIGSTHDAPASIEWKPLHGELAGFEATTPLDFYTSALSRSATIDDLRREFGGLIEAYVERLRVMKPDVVLINGTYYRPWCLLQAARSLQIPVCFFYHGSSLQEAAVESLAQELAQNIEREFSDSTAPYIFPSQLALDQSRKSLRISDAQAHIIPNSVPHDFFEVVSVRDEHVLGCVLRWETVKNTTFLSDVFRYNERLPEPYTIHLISDLAPAELAGLGAAHVELMPARDTPQLAAFYASCGAMLCPSLFETFGNVPAEAVASGTPALVSATTGVASVFREAGLERLVYSFESPQLLFSYVPDIIARGITQEERSHVKNILSEAKVCERVCAVLVAAGISSQLPKLSALQR